MSHFSTALLGAFEDLNWKQVEVARRLKVKPPQLSAYLRGKGSLGPKAFIRLYEQLPASHRGDVLRGYLLDQVPQPSEARVIVVVAAIGAALSSSSNLPSDPDADLDAALGFLTRESVGNREIRDLLLTLHRALLSANKQYP